MSIPPTTPGALPRARGLRRLALAGACAAAALATGAPGAEAGSHERILTKGGVVWFDHTGNYIGALDRRKDGYAVRAYLNWIQGEGEDSVLREEEITDTRGYRPGPPDPHRAVFRKLFIKEGTRVELTMCYAQGDFNRRCSDRQVATS